MGKRIITKRLVTHKFSIEEASKALELFESRREELLDPHSDARYLQRFGKYAEFYNRFFELTDELGVRTKIHGTPNEVADAVPFERDTMHATYDAEADLLERLYASL